MCGEGSMHADLRRLDGRSLYGSPHQSLACSYSFVLCLAEFIQGCPHGYGALLWSTGNSPVATSLKTDCPHLQCWSILTIRHISASQPSWWSPFNTAPHGDTNPNITFIATSRLYFLLLLWAVVCKYLVFDLCERIVQCPRGSDPKTENHCIIRGKI